MLTPEQFREIVSGQRRGLLAAALRTGLAAAEWPVRLYMQRRNQRYDSDPAQVTRVDAPVISVGNLTVGGTGKTPMVEWIARWLRRRNFRVTLISRGYGAEKGAVNDEARELEQKLPDVPHLQNPDRVEAAQIAIEELECQLILLDDAFQHRRIYRDLDIVLIDALAPFGYGHVLPRGLLREPVAGLSRAHAIGLTRADMASPATRQQLKAEALQHNPQAVWFEAAHQPRALLASDGSEQPLETLRGQQVAAFCGIGNPAGFRHTLAHCGYEVAAFKEYHDHFKFERDDVRRLVEWLEQQAGLAAVVCTHKDLVKIGVPRLAGLPLYAVSIGMALLSGEAELTAQLDRVTQLITRE